MRYSVPAVLALFAAIAGESPAMAETWSTADIRRCVGIEDDTQRLACFDRLAAERLAAAAEPGTRRYSTVIEGRGEPRGERTRLHDIRIVAFVREHRRGRDWRRYVSDDGRYWRLPEGVPAPELDLPFEADVVPDPEQEGAFLLDPGTGAEPIRVLPDSPSGE